MVQRRVSARVMVSEQPRLGISVGKKFGGSSDRNRFKRQVRAVFRQQREQLPAVDIVVAARTGGVAASYKDIQILFDEIINRYN